MKDESTQVAKETATDSKSLKSSATAKPRLLEFYEKKVVPALVKELNYKNVNQVPRIDKIVVNAGLGDVKDNPKSFNMAVEELATITAQKPLVTIAKKAVANFKLREGMKVGAKITLRGNKMWEFLDRLISIALPRVRDFRGVSPKSFDGKGNYSMGIKEQIVFPEIDYDKIEKVRGFDVCIVTDANTDNEAKALLTALGMPFKKA